MQLKNLSDSKLLENTKRLVLKEQETTSKIIEHLEEIEVRKLYSDLRHVNLYVYCQEELGYSRDEAYRRISAMQLSRKLPEAKVKLEEGTVTLSQMNMLAALFNGKEKFEEQDQLTILNKIEEKSKKQTKEILDSIREERDIKVMPKRVHIKDESSETVRLSVSLSKKTMDKINRVKGLFSHQNIQLDEVLEILADSLLEKHEEEMKPKRANKKQSNAKGRYISKDTKHRVYKRAEGRCEICCSTHKLEYDHMTPFSRSGTNDYSNIRLLCKNCNLRQGVTEFGVEKMKRWKESGSRE